eukprot:CAMPEP_0178456606 /NCGR_PEP_ID=MMETSP0689_2-20121128/46569_1 /TAXON_ID=160604 /ORGANISM="Amphidinium massartii, Strain CS-259" /LENGTH=102 /DNA_ID=CAMNT_0020082793 /DNA_START=49 /DNA_END=354 /DNA_ORIENTATION=+
MGHRAAHFDYLLRQISQEYDAVLQENASLKGHGHGHAHGHHSPGTMSPMESLRHQHPMVPVQSLLPSMRAGGSPPQAFEQAGSDNSPGGRIRLHRGWSNTSD